METALVSLICVAMLIVGAVTVTFNAFQSVTSVADSLRNIEQQTSETRLTEIEASQWGQTTYAIAYEDDNNDGLLKTVEIASNGLITKSAIDSLVFSSTCVEPDLKHVSGDTYVIAYQGNGDDGYITTVEIDDEGQITNTVIDTLEFDILDGLTPEIVRVSGNIYAIAYGGDGGHGFLKTVEISVIGQITDTVIDTLEFDTVACLTPDIIHISGNIFAVAYTGVDGDGFLKTVEITDGGQITDAVIDTLEFDTADSMNSHIIHISGNIFAITYTGYQDDGYLTTVEIAADGQITNTVIDTLEFDTTYGITPDITHIWGSIYVIVHEGAGTDGYLDTVEIADNGQITDTVMDSLVFDSTQGAVPNIVNTSKGFYAIAYMGDADDGFLKVVEVGTNGQITDTVIDTFEFDTLYGNNPDIIELHGGSNSFCMKVVNRGEISLTDFTKWDIIVQYETGTANYLSYTTSDNPGSNEWTVDSIYMLDDNPEVYDPDILNPGEQMKLLLNVDPAIGLRETVRITVSTPHGVKSTCMVTRN